MVITGIKAECTIRTMGQIETQCHIIHPRGTCSGKRLHCSHLNEHSVQYWSVRLRTLLWVVSATFLPPPHLSHRLCSLSFSLALCSASDVASPFHDAIVIFYISTYQRTLLLPCRLCSTVPLLPCTGHPFGITMNGLVTLLTLTSLGGVLALRRGCGLQLGVRWTEKTAHHLIAMLFSP